MPKYDIVTASSTRELVNIVNRRKVQGWVESGAPGYNYTDNVYFQAMNLEKQSGPMETKVYVSSELDERAIRSYARTQR